METSSLDQLIELCSVRPFEYSSFEALGDSSHEDLCLALSEHVAQGLASGRLTFAAADAAVNRLYSYSYHRSDRGMPDFAWQVFEAIEQGEYHHSGDGPEIDPVSTYVLPAIKELLTQRHGVRV